jgi:anti-sigma28 factor (negative regulator of flagellin synthesis)
MERMLRIRKAIAAGSYSVTAAALVDKMPPGLWSDLLA